MRKLFRFKYEPCNGTCYAWCDHLIEELRELDVTKRNQIVSLMVDAHNKLCDNPDFSFGVDVDENHTVFVAHFRTPERTDLFHSRVFSECVEKVCSEVLKTEIPQISGICQYGDNGAEDLGNEILKYCQDEAFAELKNKECPCKVVV